MAMGCSCSTHKKVKASPARGRYYLVNSKEYALPVPSFTHEEVADSTLWSQYGGEHLSTKGWAALLHLIRHNATVDEDDKLGPEQVVDLIESTMDRRDTGIPATARKKPRTASSLMDQWNRSDPFELQFQDMSRVLSTAVESAEESIADLTTFTTKLAVLLGAPSDMNDDDGFSPAFTSVELLTGKLAGMQQFLDSLKSEFQSFESASARNEENFRSHLDSVTFISQEAKAAATKAQRLIAAVEATGVVRDFAVLKSQVLDLDGKHRTLSAEVDGLFALVERLANGTSTVMGTGSPSGTLTAEFTALKTDVYDQLKAVKESVAGGGPVEIGRLSFDSVQSCMDALRNGVSRATSMISCWTRWASSPYSKGLPSIVMIFEMMLFWR